MYVDISVHVGSKIIILCQKCIFTKKRKKYLLTYIYMDHNIALITLLEWVKVHQANNLDVD